jgi:ferredoxin--NADP+ reductase
VLTADPDELARTDISDHALAVLRASRVQEVVIAARRGPADSAFTLPELIGLTTAADVVLDAEDHELVRRDLAVATDALTRQKLEILSKLGQASVPARRPRIRLAYRLTPNRLLGQDRVSGIEFIVTETEEKRQLDAGLVLSSIGYRGKRIADLPFDEAAAVVPNDHGRVVDPDTGRPVPGAYVAGWIKRGPTGFIGTNKSCSLQTVQKLVADFNDGLLTDPVAGPRALARLVHARQPDVVDAAGWKAIDAAEIARGSADERPRDKFTAVDDMLAVAAAAPTPPLRRRLADRLRQLV